MGELLKQAELLPQLLQFVLNHVPTHRPSGRAADDVVPADPRTPDASQLECPVATRPFYLGSLAAFTPEIWVSGAAGQGSPGGTRCTKGRLPAPDGEDRPSDRTYRQHKTLSTTLKDPGNVGASAIEAIAVVAGSAIRGAAQVGTHLGHAANGTKVVVNEPFKATEAK